MALALIPVVVAAAPPNARVFVAERTGVAPWSWTGLTGDAAGLCGYEIVGRTDETAGVASTVGLRINADATAVYGDSTGFPKTGIAAQFNGGFETVLTTIVIPIAKSGTRRLITARYSRADGVPEVFADVITAWSFEPTGAIARLDLDYTAGGPVTTASWKLYALMDVP